MVRFGNVINSSGSVIPLFLDQISQGGPVTVTDKNVMRYFMTIPEASQLVLQAGCMGEGGEIFLLDMGEPIQIVDLAKDMIRLSGMSIKDQNNPNGDIEINYTGKRPGEKLFEELLIDDKKMEKTNFGLRLNYFPSLPSGQDPTKGGRLLGHEDVDLFTILPAPKTEGLQVWNYHNNKWIKLKAPENSLIINVGDYLQRITNDYYRSTSHRVAKPTNNSITNNYRVSFPMAVYLWENEILEVLPGLGLPKYKPIKAITFHTKSTSKFYGDDYAVEENN